MLVEANLQVLPSANLNTKYISRVMYTSVTVLMFDFEGQSTREVSYSDILWWYVLPLLQQFVTGVYCAANDNQTARWTISYESIIVDDKITAIFEIVCYSAQAF